MAIVNMLVGVPKEQATRFYQNLSAHQDFQVRVATEMNDVFDMLADSDYSTDVLILDNTMGDVHQLIRGLRQKYPRILIVLVDEDADFGMPGQADEISTEPFENDDLAKRIKRLMSDRQMETLRSDSLPAIRNIAKQLRGATGRLGKQEAAVTACKDMGYDYVAYYNLDARDTSKLALKAHDGPKAIMAIVPKIASEDGLIYWVFKNGQSRLAGPQDTPNYPLVARGRLGVVGCVPATFSGTTYGVIIACNDRPGSMDQENILMLELVAAQLAQALSKER